ncbi:precorrin-3B C(17)-methyltransferase [Thalassoporum mexicanum]|uniref:precorrin-3B C(17)-methyltransferase n=1 Tax=Thalassoporum mexicanum TaxID=3457544 RepID=UPI0002D30412|nr:precorrin-3B C(17)-methyltransferase [Pseudanabaena sp. PCC 7367]
MLGIWLTPAGKEQLSLLQPWPGLEIRQSDRQEPFNLREQIAQAWSKYDGLVFCMAVGAVVRLIAPYLQDKTTDPAVVVIDDRGKFAISLCGGHLGGGDRLVTEISARLDAQAIITTASAGLGLPGVDLLGAPFGWQRGEGDWTKVSAAVAKQLPVQVWQESGNRLWQSHLPDSHAFSFCNELLSSIDQVVEVAEVAEIEKSEKESKQATDRSIGKTETIDISANFNAIDQEEYQARIWISVRDWRSLSTNFTGSADRTTASLPIVQWHPRLLWLGIGCERGVSAELINLAVQQTLQKYGLTAQAIAGLASIELKADEVGLLTFAEQNQLSISFFSAAQLKAIAVPNPSTVVAQEVGTPSVAEAAALLAAQQASQLQIEPDILEETEPEEAEQQLNKPKLLVNKQIVRDPAYAGAVTVAIAQATLESIDRPGQLYLVGIGPGSLAQITPAAKQAIAKADAIIGYGLYIDLIKPLLRPGQMIETYAITKERQRADRAVDLAQWGLSVAVISSGDCGIYGMAGLVLEALQARDWDGNTPDVEVVPGITALQAAAARVGTPLMHDFCAISLSDLLTPIEVITKRLVAAAQADFVIALYNPRSQTRTKPMDMALDIFLQHRDRTNPVALVKSAFRPTEQVKLTSLGELKVEDIDMFTTVLVGNSRTRFYQNHLITPRSYY